LRVIAHELVASIKKCLGGLDAPGCGACPDAGLVKRLLRKYGYPPDLQHAAVQKVLQQAEALSADWAVKLSANREMVPSTNRNNR
jgi:type I restriction enzyme, R subunit